MKMRDKQRAPDFTGPARVARRCLDMGYVVVTDVPRADPALADELAGFGVATVHEALGRTGYLTARLRPLWPGARMAGTAVTVLCWPGDNLMIHAAVELCRPGDVLVATTTSACSDAVLGELLATSYQVRGVRGAVIDGGVRDVAQLREMNFPVWSTGVSAQGTVKTTPGAVNVPIAIGGQVIGAGDVIVADDDGALCVPRTHCTEALAAARERAAREVATRAALRDGELTIDRYGLRAVLADAGVEYLTAVQYARRQAR
jgi:4-hydroxy-4-methyl-2-oxoglutarate aldolase